MVIADKLYTIDEFEAYAATQSEKLLELIDGRIVEKVISEEHGKIAIWLGYLIITYLQEHPEIKGHWSSEASYTPTGDDKNERRPDVSFRLTDKAVSRATRFEGMPDFVAEVKSKTNSYDELREKAKFYLEQGSRLVWLIYPEPQFVEVYFEDGTSAAFKEGQTLSGENVLPNFEVPVSKLFNF
ncbi:MAG: Uma2 family endonuclease [Anaerolineae bacterium]|nr:Uma2 family endonuclease [Anaerolineae bacterium]MDQ7034018.1 Uma2 family endonuclease [Anaerolineae bacterium]